MDIEDRKLTQVVSIGKYDRKGETPRTLLFHTENNLNKDLILKSTRKLKDYEEYAEPVYLSVELNAGDSKKMHVSRDAKNSLGKEPTEGVSGFETGRSNFD